MIFRLREIQNDSARLYKWIRTIGTVTRVGRMIKKVATTNKHYISKVNVCRKCWQYSRSKYGKAEG